jgi:hypothetical protein
LIVLDCEDCEPVETGAELVKRISCLGADKKVGVILFKSEFESLFLFCLPEIAKHFPEYGWHEDRLLIEGDPEVIRDAKGRISLAMRERAYKPTRDQEKFITPLVFERLEQHSKSFCRFEEALLWLVGRRSAQVPFYPRQ